MTTAQPEGQETPLGSASRGTKDPPQGGDVRRPTTRRDVEDGR